MNPTVLNLARLALIVSASFAAGHSLRIAAWSHTASFSVGFAFGTTGVIVLLAAVAIERRPLRRRPEARHGR